MAKNQALTPAQIKLADNIFALLASHTGPNGKPYSQQALADEMGVSKGLISQYFNHLTAVSAAAVFTTAKLCKLHPLEIDPDCTAIPPSARMWLQADSDEGLADAMVEIANLRHHLGTTKAELIRLKSAISGIESRIRI